MLACELFHSVRSVGEKDRGILPFCSSMKQIHTLACYVSSKFSYSDHYWHQELRLFRAHIGDMNNPIDIMFPAEHKTSLSEFTYEESHVHISLHGTFFLNSDIDIHDCCVSFCNLKLQL